MRYPPVFTALGGAEPLKTASKNHLHGYYRIPFPLSLCDTNHFDLVFILTFHNIRSITHVNINTKTKTHFIH